MSKAVAQRIARDVHNAITDDFGRLRPSAERQLAEHIARIRKRAQAKGRRAGILLAANTDARDHKLCKGLVEGSMEAYHWSNGYVSGAVGKRNAILGLLPKKR